MRSTPVFMRVLAQFFECSNALNLSDGLKAGAFNPADDWRDWLWAASTIDQSFDIGRRPMRWRNDTRRMFGDGGFRLRGDSRNIVLRRKQKLAALRLHSDCRTTAR